jgi:hypothetical protein
MRVRANLRESVLAIALIGIASGGAAATTQRSPADHFPVARSGFVKLAQGPSAAIPRPSVSTIHPNPNPTPDSKPLATTGSRSQELRTTVRRPRRQ